MICVMFAFAIQQVASSVTFVVMYTSNRYLLEKSIVDQFSSSRNYFQPIESGLVSQELNSVAQNTWIHALLGLNIFLLFFLIVKLLFLGYLILYHIEISIKGLTTLEYSRKLKIELSGSQSDKTSKSISKLCFESFRAFSRFEWKRNKRNKVNLKDENISIEP
ncbi:hypothetical protein BKA69DRAFT_1125677 [Paraphysoderma sedebokerense]|nr:hypothetical protein BKA69DRAFT_1125677 [Paraphysoderma sedebokerense]